MAKKVLHKTIAVPTQYAEELAQLFEQNQSNFAKASPMPNIAALKRDYWGNDAYCISCGDTVYKVDADTYGRFVKFAMN